MSRFGRELAQTADPQRARYLIDRLRSYEEGAIGSFYDTVQNPHELVRVELARLGDKETDGIFACVHEYLLEDPSPRVVEQAIASLVAMAERDWHAWKVYPALMLLRHILREPPAPDGDALSRGMEVKSLLDSLPSLWWEEPRARALLPLLRNETGAPNIRRAMLAAAAIERIERAAR